MRNERKKTIPHDTIFDVFLRNLQGSTEVDTPINHEEPIDDGSSPFPKVYGELRALASGYLRRQRKNHTLQPTALVHEAFMKLLRHESAGLGAGNDLVRLAFGQ